MGGPKCSIPWVKIHPVVITGLEAFNAVAAILVCTHSGALTRIVGVCNQRDAGTGPFLAPDGKVLNDIIQLVAIGARTGERHAQELHSIQKTSAAISAVLDLDELLPMVAKQAAEAFDASATSVMLWDESRRRTGHQSERGFVRRLHPSNCVSLKVLFMLNSSGMDRGHW